MEQKQIRTAPHPRCVLCGADGKLLYSNLIDGLFDAPGEWNLKQCPNAGCGMIWLDPAPIPEDLHIPYETYFTHDDAQGAGFIPRLRAVLYSAYKSAKSIPSGLVGLSEAQRQIRHMYLHDRSPGRVLDVGCGDGTFLNFMRSQGWKVEGLDFDPKAIESAKTKYGLELRHGDLHSARFPDSCFDAVTLSHVIEHVPDPVDLLKEIGRILKPNGRVVATTPNTGSYGHEKFRKYWVGLDPPRHLNLFTLRALAECAKRAGLEVERTFSTAANADIVLGGSYAVCHFNQVRRRPQINIIRSLKSAWLQYSEFISLRNNPEAGEEAVLIAKKKAG